MRRFAIFRRYRMLALGIATVVSLGSVKATDLNPAALIYQLPNQIKWVDTPNGASQAVVRGDLSKPGPYIELVIWHAHHMSRPHFHPNDRFINVISGTWWLALVQNFRPTPRSRCPPEASSLILASKFTMTAPRMRTSYWKSSGKGRGHRLPPKRSRGPRIRGASAEACAHSRFAISGDPPATLDVFAACRHYNFGGLHDPVPYQLLWPGLKEKKNESISPPRPTNGA